MNTSKNIVYLGCTGFPLGLAEVQKIILISKCLCSAGNNVTVICNKGVLNKIHNPDMKASGTYDGIKYVYTSGSPFRNKNFWIRNLLKIKGKFNEFTFLRKMNKTNKIHFAVLSTHSFSAVLFYSVLARLYKFKTALNYVEFESGKKKKWSQLGKRVNDKLFDKYAIRLSDVVLPISNFLIDQIKKVSPNKKYLKIPGLTDFEKYNDIEAFDDKKYFIFCGSTIYKEVILFCIDSFGQLNNNDSVLLYLVINGDENDMLEIKNYIDNNLEKERIKIFTRLSEKQLYTYYKNAIALLIPLRPTLGDIARFPHKTGEYMASGNPVISTNYGEMKVYFTDMENMFLAETYDKNQFAEKMRFVIDNPVQSKKIGEHGKKLAYNLFHFKSRTEIINNFLEDQL